MSMILDDDFVDTCIEATMEHCQHDPDFLNHVGILPKSEKGRSFLKGYLAIKWHLGLLGYSQCAWAWETDGLKEQREVKKVMTFKQFMLMLRHFRCTRASQLPSIRSNLYHPLQNIQSGVIKLRDNARALWLLGNTFCIDEGRMKSKSRRNKYKTRNISKPIRMGMTINKIGNKGIIGGYFVYNHLVGVGRYTYTDTAKGKFYNIVDQLTENLKHQGKTVVMDSAFPTVILLKDAKTEWTTRIVSTQGKYGKIVIVIVRIIFCSLYKVVIMLFLNNIDHT